MKPVFKKRARLALAVALMASSFGAIKVFASEGDNCGDCANAYDQAVNDADAAYDECITGCLPGNGCAVNCDLARTSAIESANAELWSCMDQCTGC